MNNRFLLAAILGLGLCLLCNSCGDLTSVQGPDYATLDAVTGLEFTDASGVTIGTWQEPNHNPGPVNIFPIPNDGRMNVASTEIVVNIWVIPAYCFVDSVNTNIPSLSMDLGYDIEDIEALTAVEIPADNFNGLLALQLDQLSTGFYKVFYEMSDGELFWTNIYVDPSINSFPGFSFFDDLCN